LHSTWRSTLARVSAAENLQRLLRCGAGNAAPAHAATASADAARRRARSQRTCRARSPH
jgi:GTP cyclohydrolase III